MTLFEPNASHKLLYGLGNHLVRFMLCLVSNLQLSAPLPVMGLPLISDLQYFFQLQGGEVHFMAVW